jgi:hypothetical protein
MADSNTARSKRWLEKQGWTVGGTEQIVRIPPRFPGDKPKMFKRDLFNFADMACFKPLFTEPTNIKTGNYKEIDPMMVSGTYTQWDVKRGDCGVMLVQTTTTANQAARVTKIKGIPEAEGWLRSGGRIQVHGWRQKGGKGGRWLLTVQEIGIDEDFPGTLKSEEKNTANAPLFEGE